MTRPLAPGEGKRATGNVLKNVAEDLKHMDQTDVSTFAQIALLAARGSDPDAIIDLCQAGMERNMASAHAEKSLALGDIKDAEDELLHYQQRKQEASK